MYFVLYCFVGVFWVRHLYTTLSTLRELRFEKPYLIVMNKSETIEDRTVYPRDSIFISAKYGQGLEDLKTAILSFFRSRTSEIRLKIPYDKLSAYGKLKKYAAEKSFSYRDDALYVRALVENIHLGNFKEFMI